MENILYAIVWVYFRWFVVGHLFSPQERLRRRTPYDVQDARPLYFADRLMNTRRFEKWRSENSCHPKQLCRGGTGTGAYVSRKSRCGRPTHGATAAELGHVFGLEWKRNARRTNDRNRVSKHVVVWLTNKTIDNNHNGGRACYVCTAAIRGGPSWKQQQQQQQPLRARCRTRRDTVAISARTVYPGCIRADTTVKRSY